MKLYHYDSQTKIFITEQEVGDNYIMPQGTSATTKKPPKEDKGKISLYHENEWIQLSPVYLSEANSNGIIPKTLEEQKNILRNIRNRLLNEADLVYCNAELWESMNQQEKQKWKNWKQKMRDWIDVDFDMGVFPSSPAIK